MKSVKLSSNVLRLLNETVQQEVASSKLEIPRPIENAESTAMPSQALDVIRQRASVVGQFDPEAMIKDVAGKEDQRKLIQELSSEAREEVSAGKRRWVLLPDVRRDTLAGLTNQQLKRALKSSRPEDQDGFGHMLQDALRGKTPRLKGLSVEDLSTLQTAAEFANVAPQVETAPETLRLELARRSFQESVEAVLPRRMIGRSRQIRRIVHFARSRSTSTQAPLIVTGIGGSGKSAVLASVRKQLQDRSPRIPVVILDCDRPQVGRGRVTDLTLELTKQLAYAYPEIAKDFRELRETIVHDQLPYQQNASFTDSESVDFSITEALREVVERHKLHKRPIALIIDTFEEVMVQGAEAVEHVLRWIPIVRSEAGLTGIRAIVSGRAAADSLAEMLKESTLLQSCLPGWSPEDAVRIENLEPAEAERLLVERGVGADAARILAPAFGGNPLLLILLANFVLKNPRVKPEALARDAARRSGKRGSPTIAYLYGRILKNIPNDDLKPLASPGLLLRRVTPELIEKVLAEPCDLGTIDRDRAQALFDQLASQVWLVQRAGAGEIHHRRDLRQVMLPLITGNDPSVAKRIHRAAARYYDAGFDPALAPDLQKAEAVYHRLLAKEQKVIDARSAALLAPNLGTDIDHMPPAVRGKIKQGLGQSLSGEEIRPLPIAERLQTAQLEIERKLDRGEFQSARQVMEAALGPRDRRKLDPALVLAIYRSTGEVRLLARDSVDLAKRTLKSSEPWWNRRGDSIQHPLWTTAVFASQWHRESQGLSRVLARMVVPRTTTIEMYAMINAAFALVRRRVGAKKGLEYRRRELERSERRLSHVDWERVPRKVANILVLGYNALVKPIESFDGVSAGAFALLDRDTARALRDALVRRTLVASNMPGKTLDAELSSLIRIRPGAYVRLGKLEATLRRIGRAGVKANSRAGSRFLQGRFARGTTPEFRDPACAALLDAIPQMSADAYSMFTEEVWNRLRVQPREFRPALLFTALNRDRRRWVTALVDCYDRSSKLGVLLDLALKRVPHHKKLRAVRDDYFAFDRMLRNGVSRGTKAAKSSRSR